MKNMTRRNFLKLSGAAVLAVSAGALTACSGGGGGIPEVSTISSGDGADDIGSLIGEGTVTKIDESSAKQVGWVTMVKDVDGGDVVKYPQNSTVGNYSVYPLQYYLAHVEDYGMVAAVAVNISNYSGTDLTIGVGDVMVCLNGTAVPIIGLEGGDDMNQYDWWGKSITIHPTTPRARTDEERFDQSSTVCIYADAREHKNVRSMKTVLKLGNAKVKIEA